MNRNIRFILNEGKLIAQTTAVALAKAEVYKAVLKPMVKSGIADFNLSLDNKPSPFSTASSEVKRNNIILKSFDGSVEIELITAECDVVPSNTIVETPIIGKRGTVKEYISSNDYKVNISGMVFSDSANSFPLYEQIAFKKLLDTERYFEVDSVYLGLWGITKLVYKTGSFKPNKKFVNAFDFKLQCLSDEDFSLYVEE